jgi:hypothetical protein
MRKLAIIITALALTACTKTTTAQQLVGTWEQVALYYYSEDGERHDVRTFVPESLTFYTDGTAIFQGDKFKYSLTQRDGETFIYFVYPDQAPLSIRVKVTRLEGDNLRYIYKQYEYSFMRRGPTE